ncbi:MAG: hypothetical protein ACT4ON_01040 [Bacteroidota bacterium]
MTKEKTLKENLINFQIKAVDLISSHIQPPTTPFSTHPNFNFNIAVEQKLDHNNKSLIVLTNIDIATAENLDFKLASATVACLFAIENYEDVVKIDKNKHVIINPEVLDILNSISISTTRGVMSQVFKGTFLHNAILPVIDPKALKKEK